MLCRDLPGITYTDLLIQWECKCVAKVRILTYWPEQAKALQWDFVFETILSFRNNRLIVLQNWNSIWASKPVSTAGITALSKALGTAPACLVDSATTLHASKINSTAYRLLWTPTAAAGGGGGCGGGKAGGCETQEVLASAVPLQLPSGALAAPTLLNAAVAATAAAVTLRLPSDPALELVHWQVVSRGCGGTQTAVSDAAAFVL